MIQFLRFKGFNLTYMLIVALMLSSCGTNKELPCKQINSVVEDNQSYDSNSVAGLINQAHLCEKLGNYDEALRYYNQAVTINPTIADIYYKRGVVYYKERNNKSAAQDFDLAVILKPTITIEPKYAVVYVDRGSVLNDLGDKEGALQSYNLAIKLDPNSWYAYYSRYSLYNDLGDEEDALKDYNQAMAINPKSATDYDNLVKYTEKTEKNDTLNQPKDANFYIDRAALRSATGYKKGALQDYSEAIKLDSKDYLLYYWRANVRNDLADKEGALQDYSMSIDLDAAYAESYKQRSIVRKELGDEAGAVEDHRKYTELLK